MSESAEGGAALAWRLLATLEGGSLLLAAAALLAFSARGRRRRTIPVRTVLVTNTRNQLGSEIRRLLEAHSCVVISLTDLPSDSEESDTENKVDALVVVGAELKTEGLEGITNVVSADVYDNLKLLEGSCVRVRCGGRVCWASAGAGAGTFAGAGAALHDVLRAALLHVAHTRKCEPVWVGGGADITHTAETLVSALLTSAAAQHSRFSVRNAATKLSEYIGRWLKIIT